MIVIRYRARVAEFVCREGMKGKKLRWYNDPFKEKDDAD